MEIEGATQHAPHPVRQSIGFTSMGYAIPMRKTLPLAALLLAGAQDGWIAGDVEAGFAEARTSGKPLAVVLRCVP